MLGGVSDQGRGPVRWLATMVVRNTVRRLGNECTPEDASCRSRALVRIVNGSVAQATSIAGRTCISLFNRSSTPQTRADDA
jgi:hypothetical protein